MRNHPLRLIPAGLAFMAALFFQPIITNAQAVGTWDFANTLTGTPASYNTVSLVSLGPAISSAAFNGGTEYYGQGGWPSGAINTSAYLEFTLTPSSGYQLDLTGLVVRVRRSNTGTPSGSGPTSWSLRSSIDGYAADIASGSMTHNYANYSIPLGSGFHSIYGAVTFRVYGYNATTSSGGSSRMVFDQITVSGLNIVLPVRLGSLRGSREGDRATLDFRSFDGTAQHLYRIERSHDGQHFSEIAALDGSDQPDHVYHYEDQQLESNRDYYYRISVEEAGRKYYSGIIRLSKVMNTTGALFLAGSNMHIPRFNGKAMVSIHTMDGRSIFRAEVTGDARAGQVMTVPAPIVKGTYVLNCQGNDTRISNKVYIQ